MGLVDHEGGADYPYATKHVYEAVVAAVQGLKKMKMVSCDELTCRVVVKASASAFSWGENIPISVTELASGKSRVAVLSTPKTGLMMGGAFDMGKNRKNIEAILSAVSQELSSKPQAAQQAAPQAAGDAASRIVQLKSLLDQGHINEAEFESKKAEILAQI
jgi:hypothetical protein